MSFDLVEHRILRVFGGIQAEKNTSIQSLEGFQKKLFTAMKKAQNCHKKISQSLMITKDALSQLNDNYLHISKEKRHNGQLVHKLQYEIGQLLQKISEQSLGFSRKMEKKVETYLPNFRKMKQKYTQCADTQEHYKQKVSLLRKNVEKQSLAKLSKDEHERYQRNKDKLRIAETEHDEMLTRLTKRFAEFNNEALKDIYYDFLSVTATFGGQVFSMASKLTTSLHQSFGAKEILLIHQLSKKDQINILRQSSNLEIKDHNTNAENKTKLLEHLVHSNQIANYLRTILDRELAKLENSYKISEAFNKKEEQNISSDKFNAFQNQYQTRVKKLSQIKEDDPIEVGQDLLSVEDATAMSPQFSGISDSELVEVEFPEDDGLYIRQESERGVNLINNLQKFNKICEQKRAKSPKHSITNKNDLKDLQNYIHSNRKHPQKYQSTVTAHDFFNFHDKSTDKKETTNQQMLNKLHEHPLTVSELQSESVGPKMFQSFDFFAQTTPSLSNQPQSIKSPVKEGNIGKKTSHFDLINF